MVNAKLAASKVGKNEMITTSEMAVRKLLGGGLSASALGLLALDFSPGVVATMLGAGVMLIQMGVMSQ